MVNLFKAGDNENGIRTIKKLNELAVENNSTIYHKALYDYRKGYFERCLAKLDRCLKTDKNNRQVNELIFMARSKLSEINEKKGIYAMELFNKGVRHLKSGDYKMAVLSFQDSLSNKTPETTGSISGDVLDKKIAVMEIYSKISIYYNMATAFELSGKFEDSIAALEKINDFKNDIDIINFKIAQCYSKIGNETEAFKYYSITNRVNGSFPNINNKLAFSAKKLGDYELSISYFRQAIAQDPKNPINHYNLAIMYKKSERYLESYEVFQKTLSLLSKSDNSLKYLVNEQISSLNLKANGVKATNKQIF